MLFKVVLKGRVVLGIWDYVNKVLELGIKKWNYDEWGI